MCCLRLLRPTTSSFCPIRPSFMVHTVQRSGAPHCVHKIRFSGMVSLSVPGQISLVSFASIPVDSTTPSCLHPLTTAGLGYYARWPSLLHSRLCPVMSMASLTVSGLQRCGKSCRLRWTNYLRPDLKHGQFSPAEEETIMKLHAVVGNRWSLIAAQLPGRTDNDVKNHWNTKLKKKLTGMGIDPVTHKSFSHLMTEIATTLGPPQVANLTEAALGCFKDEMLHLLTKKRIDSQLLPVPFNNTITSTNTTEITTIDTTYPHPTNNHLNINNNRDNSNVIMMSRKADDHKGTKHSDTHDDHDDTVEKIKIGLSRAIRQCPSPYHHDILISNNNSNDESNIMRPCWETITQEQANTFTEFQYGQSSFGHNNNEDEDEENDGSPWNQSMCTGSNSTEGGDRAAGYLKLDQQGHENNITTMDGDGDDSQGIRIRNESGGIFSSDCVLWDLPSDELVNPMI